MHSLKQIRPAFQYHSYKAVAWPEGEQMAADLVINALNMALQMRQPSNVIPLSEQC